MTKPPTVWRPFHLTATFCIKKWLHICRTIARECGNRRTWLGLGNCVSNHIQELVWVCFKKHVGFSVFSHTPCYSFRTTWSQTEFPNWEIRPSHKPKRYKDLENSGKHWKMVVKKSESELQTGSSSDRSAQLIFLHVLNIHHICMAKNFMFQVTPKKKSSTKCSRPLECETLAMEAHFLLTVISLFKSHKAWAKNGPMMWLLELSFGALMGKGHVSTFRFTRVTDTQRQGVCPFARVTCVQTSQSYELPAFLRLPLL